VACDAIVTPVVTGEVDPGVLQDLVGPCLRVAGAGPGPLTAHAREMLQRAIIAKTINFLSRSYG
jgi:hypothetical protein